MVEAARRKPLRIGPQDDGRRMSLDEFDHAIVEEGYVYELGKGVIEVSEVPAPGDAKQVQAIQNQLGVYQEKHPEVIDLLAHSNECKLLIGADQSERHPDLSLYLSPQPEISDV